MTLVSLKQCETMGTVATNQNPITVRSLIHIVLWFKFTVEPKLNILVWFLQFSLELYPVLVDKWGGCSFCLMILALNVNNLSIFLSWRFCKNFHHFSLCSKSFVNYLWEKTIALQCCVKDKENRHCMAYPFLIQTIENFW